ncbi:hypothetical protein ACIQ1H_09245 [Lysinibacillus sp. NPDC097279]|uniref:hypothetical protein n=1 Tax=Lysinibacillus sp. NPDC097279 TaxID=3364143 RepID=UPI00380F02F6
MANSTVEISILYKNDNWDNFSIPDDEVHAKDLVDIGAQVGSFNGEPTFMVLTNKNTSECLFVNLGEVRTVHMKTVVTE